MIRRILVTGAGPTGFIGRNLAETLVHRYQIYSPPSAQLDLRNYDEVERYIDKHKIEAIIHACSCKTNTMESDLKMYFNLEKASRNISRMICFGSGAEFDKRYDIIMAKESDIGVSIPVDGYGFAKYVMTTHARLSKNIYVLRPFGIFGKYEDWTFRFISNLCCKAVYGLPLTIRRDCKFDFIYIDDLTDVIEWFLENKPVYHDYNFCYGHSVNLTELAKMVLQASGKNLEINILNPHEVGNEYTANNERLRKEMSEFMPTPLSVAVEKLYAYYYENSAGISYDVLRETM